MRVREAHTVFIPLCASSHPFSGSQIGSAHNVSLDVTLSESIVSQDLHSHCHIRPLQRSQWKQHKRSIPMMHRCTSAALENSWGRLFISNYWSCTVLWLSMFSQWNLYDSACIVFVCGFTWAYIIQQLIHLTNTILSSADNNAYMFIIEWGLTCFLYQFILK